jgi:PleD family two-component response regulator
MDRLRERFKAQPEAANAQVSMTIGVFIDPRATLTIESLLARADALMYEAKREGRDRVIARELNETSPMAA